MRSYPNTPPLLSALSTVLPTPEQTLLLRACLCSADAARGAWKAWPRQGNRLREEKGPVQSLRGLLLNAIQRHGIVIDAENLTYLRTAYVKEELRLRTYNRIVCDVLSALTDANIRFIVLKGAALAHTVYQDPALRHCHDIDLLIRGRDVSGAASLLRSLRFKRVSAPEPRMDHWKFEHASGLPLELHSRLFQIPYCHPPLAEIWARSQSNIIAGVPAHILAAPDNLLHVCAHASFCRSRLSLRWVSDAWFVIDRYRDLDWDLLLDCASRSHLALPLSVTISYLVEDLNAAVPMNFLNRLFAAASNTNSSAREFALFAARSAPAGGFRNLFCRAAGWRGRAFIIKWMLFPSPTYTLWGRQIRSSWLLPLLYFYRPVRYVLRRIRGSIKNSFRRIGIRKIVLPRKFPMSLSS